MEDKQYKELTDFIGDNFGRVYNEFERVHKRIDAVDSKFEYKFDELKQNFIQLQSTVDAYAHKADTYFQELAAMGNKMDRLEKWINQIAEKVGIKLG